MTATERVCELLDERGVEHGALNSIVTTWTGGVCSWIAIEDKDGLAIAVYRDYLTPEQAIAATLGSCSRPCNCTNGGRTDGTCKNCASGYDDFSCSECGYQHNSEHGDGDGERWHFCPNCGRRVVDA